MFVYDIQYRPGTQLVRGILCFFLFRLTVHLTKPVQCFFSSIKTLLVFYVHLMLTQIFNVFLRAVTFVTMIAMACCESVRLAGFWCSLSLLFYTVYVVVKN